MDARIAHDFLLPACNSLFPPHFNTPAARALLLAIGLQESDFEHRQQLIGNHRNWWESIRGPATSFWQFEKIGIQEVFRHPATRQHALRLIAKLGYPEDVNVIHSAIKHNDLLAVGIARLAIYRTPYALPKQHEYEEAWRQYLQVWRPGKPKPDRWQMRYATAWEIVNNP